MRRLLLTADVILTLDEKDRIHRPGYVLIEGDRIAALGPRAEWKAAADETVDLSGRLLMPGLVNAHTHTPMVLLRGLAEGRSLLTWDGWYNAIRVWEQVMDGAMVPPAVLVSCAEMIRTGTTCFADQYFYMDHIVLAIRVRSRATSYALAIPRGPRRLPITLPTAGLSQAAEGIWSIPAAMRGFS